MQCFQAVGQPSVSTNSRGKPKGKSKAPTQCAGCLSQAVKPSSVGIRSNFESITRLLFANPMAKTIGFLELGLLEKSQPTTLVTSTTSNAGNQARPMMEAVAISSSKSAIDTTPEVLYGSNSGFSAYFNKMEELIFSMLTCPMVQPLNRRSEISS